MDKFRLVSVLGGAAGVASYGRTRGRQCTVSTSFSFNQLCFQESLKQKTVGRTEDGINFPVATKLEAIAAAATNAYEIVIWVSANFYDLQGRPD